MIKDLCALYTGLFLIVIFDKISADIPVRDKKF